VQGQRVLEQPVKNGGGQRQAQRLGLLQHGQGLGRGAIAQAGVRHGAVGARVWVQAAVCQPHQQLAHALHVNGVRAGGGDQGTATAAAALPVPAVLHQLLCVGLAPGLYSAQGHQRLNGAPKGIHRREDAVKGLCGSVQDFYALQARARNRAHGAHHGHQGRGGDFGSALRAAAAAAAATEALYHGLLQAKVALWQGRSGVLRALLRCQGLCKAQGAQRGSGQGAAQAGQGGSGILAGQGRSDALRAAIHCARHGVHPGGDAGILLWLRRSPCCSCCCCCRLELCLRLRCISGGAEVPPQGVL
jgi:hypothetical protein